MDTALPQKFPFILDRNLAKANCYSYSREKGTIEKSFVRKSLCIIAMYCRRIVETLLVPRNILFCTIFRLFILSRFQVYEKQKNSTGTRANMQYSRYLRKNNITL